MTILEVANKLNITKNTLKYRMKNMPSEYLFKTDRINYITPEGYQWLLKNATDLKTGGETDSKKDINQSTDSKLIDKSEKVEKGLSNCIYPY